jgi:hypothetical protein
MGSIVHCLILCSVLYAPHADRPAAGFVGRPLSQPILLIQYANPFDAFMSPLRPRNRSIGEECSSEEVIKFGCYEFYNQNDAATRIYAPSVLVWRT